MRRLRIAALLIPFVLSATACPRPRPSLSPLPVGTVIAYAGTNPGSLSRLGWELCDGRPLRSTGFAALHAAIGAAHGNGQDDQDRVTDFNLPDYRGLFLRGVSDSARTGEGSQAGKDPERLDDRDPERGQRVENRPGGNRGNRVGSIERDQMRTHRHIDAGHDHKSDAAKRTGSVTADNSDERAAPENPPAATIEKGFAVLGAPAALEGEPPVRHGRETRPINAYVYFLCKVRE